MHRYSLGFSNKLKLFHCVIISIKKKATNSIRKLNLIKHIACVFLRTLISVQIVQWHYTENFSHLILTLSRLLASIVKSFYTKYPRELWWISGDRQKSCFVPITIQTHDSLDRKYNFFFFFQWTLENKFCEQYNLGIFNLKCWKTHAGFELERNDRNWNCKMYRMQNPRETEKKKKKFELCYMSPGKKTIDKKNFKHFFMNWVEKKEKKKKIAFIKLPGNIIYIYVVIMFMAIIVYTSTEI